MKTIEIPDDLYTKLLEETLKKGHREVHILIRNLLNQRRNQDSVSEEVHPFINGSGKNLVTKGGSIPNGTKLRCTYKGRVFSAVVDSGSIVVEGERFRSPTEAAIYVAKIQGNDRASINGWKFWEYFNSDTGQWEVLDNFREKLSLNDKSSETPNISDERILTCRAKRADAKGKWFHGKFNVLKGSFAESEETPSLQKGIRKIRKNLLNKGVLQREGDRLKFISDESFNSISQAACVVMGRSANGKTEWMPEKQTP